MTSTAPKMGRDVLDAYESMHSPNSSNDYFVAQWDAEPGVVRLLETGRGGIDKVVQVLHEQLARGIGVAMFRVTAVDERGALASLRTKLVHVIFVGPETPFMQRARVAAANKALKEPFTINLAIQTDDAHADLTKAAVEKALRASGGAHQPTSFDFDNVAVPGASFVSSVVSGTNTSGAAAPAAESPSARRGEDQPFSAAAAADEGEPSAPAAEPVGARAALQPRIESYKALLQSRDTKALLEQWYDDSSVLLHHRVIAAGSTLQSMLETYEGTASIAGFFESLFELITHQDENEGEGEGEDRQRAEEEEIDFSEERVGDDVATLTWSCGGMGVDSVTDTVVLRGGKVVHQTVTTVVSSSGLNDQMTQLLTGFEALFSRAADPQHVMGGGDQGHVVFEEEEEEEHEHEHEHEHGDEEEEEEGHGHAHHHHGHHHGHDHGHSHEAGAEEPEEYKGATVELVDDDDGGAQPAPAAIGDDAEFHEVLKSLAEPAGEERETDMNAMD